MGDMHRKEGKMNNLGKNVLITIISVAILFGIVSVFTFVVGWCFGVSVTWKVAFGVFVTTLYVMAIGSLMGKQ